MGYCMIKLISERMYYSGNDFCTSCLNEEKCPTISPYKTATFRLRDIYCLSHRDKSTEICQKYHLQNKLHIKLKMECVLT